MKLLVAADSVITLEILLKEIAARSWPVGTEARVISVVEDGEIPLETWRAEGYGMAAIRREMRTRGEQLTTLASDRLQAAGIPVEVTVMRGDPEFLIPFVAKKWTADLIFIRAHNRTDFRNWLLGSVAKSVVENAPASVEIVRAAETDQLATHDGTRILLATDGSDVSLAAAQAVAETDWPSGSEVKVISVVDPIIYSLEELGLSREKRTERAHRAIGQAINVFKETPLRLTGEVIAGTVVRQIIERGETWKADLIVVGTHQRRGLKRLLLGSTSTAVANNAHSSVRVIRADVPRSHQPRSYRAKASASNPGTVYRLDDRQRWRNAA